MMRVRLIALVIGIGVPATAETVVVRSGDHDTFTRLTLALPDDATWRTIEGENEVRISIGGIRPDFDVSTVFDRIARDRVGSIATADASIQVAINCDCTTEAFQTRSGLVVLDVVDKASAETFSSLDLLGRSNASFPYRFAPQQAEKSRNTDSFQGSGQMMVDGLPSFAELPITAPSGTEQEAVTEAVGVLQGQSFLPVVDQRLLQDADARQQDVSAAEDRLVQQISQASGQGLLTLEQPNTFDRSTRADTPLTTLESEEADRITAAGVERGLNLTTSSALDESLQASTEVVSRIW